MPIWSIKSSRSSFLLILLTVNKTLPLSSVSSITLRRLFKFVIKHSLGASQNKTPLTGIKEKR